MACVMYFSDKRQGDITRVCHNLRTHCSKTMEIVQASLKVTLRVVLYRMLHHGRSIAGRTRHTSADSVPTSNLF